MRTFVARAVVAAAVLTGTAPPLSTVSAQDTAVTEADPSRLTACCGQDGRYWRTSVRRCSHAGGLITSADMCRGTEAQYTGLRDEARCCRGGGRDTYASAQACRADGGLILRGRNCGGNDTAILVAYTGGDPVPRDRGNACCWRRGQLWYAHSRFSCRRARARLIAARYCRDAAVGQGPDGKVTISDGSYDILADEYGAICCRTPGGLRYAVSHRACRRADGRVLSRLDCEDAALRFEVEIPPLAGPRPWADRDAGGRAGEAPYEETGEGAAEAAFETPEEETYEETGKEADDYPEETGYEEPDDDFEEGGKEGGG